MKFLRHISTSFVFLLLLAAGCSRSRDARLQNLYELTSTDPRQTLTALDTINTAGLSAADRDFADFVRLKASDKLYIDHTSDSTILRLLDRFRNDPDLGPEMLYYAGRVYRSLGDYPTALSYFQAALDATPADENLQLRATVASQTGRLLNTIKLHTQAVPYLKETLRLDSLLRDTVNLMYDHQLLGAIYMRANKLDSAELTLNKGLEWTRFLPENEKSKIDLYLANIAFEKGDSLRALELIRGVPEKQEPKFRNLSLLYATKIYLANGITDTAFRYADQLIHSSYNLNKNSAYQILFSSNLRNLIPEDSVATYLNRYNDLLNYYSQNNEIENAILQNTCYNYQNHELKRLAAENDRRKVTVWALIGLLISFVLLTLLLYSRLRSERYQKELQKALADILTLKDLILNDTLESSVYEQSCVNDIKERLKAELLALGESGQLGIIKPEVMDSEIVKTINNRIEKRTAIDEKDKIWADLDSLISEAHPGFKNKINLLIGGPLSEMDYRVLMLIKCGIKPTQMSLLLRRARNTISERRRTLCTKILGEKLGLDTFENIIRLL